MDEPSPKLSEEDLGNVETEPCEAEPSKMEPRQAKEKTQKGCHSCSSCCGYRRHRRHSNNVESFTSYFSRVLKQVHMGLSLSQEAVNIVNSFVMDMLQRTTKDTGLLACNNKCHTIISREIQTSVRLLLPEEMGKHAMSEATKAVIKYTTSR